MKIEMVEFYPIKDRNHIGTLHIYIVECNMDLRGIRIFPTKTGYFFQLPGEYVKDEEDNDVFYPYISFINDDDKKSLMQQLIIKGTEYINKYLKEKENDTK